MAKKQKHEEHENHERWLVSYADFITLLFAFFVVLYSVSRVDNKKMQQASASIQWALNYSGTGGVGSIPIFDGPPSEGGCSANIGNAPRRIPSNTSVAVQALQKRIEKRLKRVLIERGPTNTVSVVVEGKRLAVRLAAVHFFDPASNALRPEALPVLDSIAEELVVLNKALRVEGHTDDTPVSSPRFRNNWELSAARAATVVAYLEAAHNIPAASLTAAGMGSSRPLGKSDTAEGREANRRVEIVVELEPDDVLSVASR